jgi:hypothetical protein
VDNLREIDHIAHLVSEGRAYLRVGLPPLVDLQRRRVALQQVRVFGGY